MRKASRIRPFSRESREVPSDTKLLLTKNYSKIIIFVQITNFTRNSQKMSLFPGDLESAKRLKNYEK